MILRRVDSVSLNDGIVNSVRNLRDRAEYLTESRRIERPGVWDPCATICTMRT